MNYSTKHNLVSVYGPLVTRTGNAGRSLVHGRELVPVDWNYQSTLVSGLYIDRSFGYFIVKDRQGVSVRARMHSHTFSNPVVNINIICVLNISRQR